MNELSEKDKNLQWINSEIERLQAALSASKDRANEVDWKKINELKRKIDSLKKQREANEQEYNDLVKRLEASVDENYTDTSPNTIFEWANLDGEKVILPGSGYPLKQLLRSYCIHLSNWNNPFDKNYTLTQQKELMESITGKAVVLNIGTADNPTPYSYDWYKKWWQFFKDYADNWLYYDSLDELEKLEAYVVPDVVASKKRKNRK